MISHSTFGFKLVLFWFFRPSCLVRNRFTSEHQKTQPDVRFIITADPSFDTIHSRENAHIQTPNMDRLVRESCTFRNASIIAVNSLSPFADKQGKDFSQTSQSSDVTRK